jgi:hypothetical protein
MINFFIRGQTLTVSQPVIAADSVNYLTAKFTFQTADWDGAAKYAHFSNGELSADIPLTDDAIRAEDGLNLTEGAWTVSVTGETFEGGELAQRITTGTVTLTVVPSGVKDGEPLPSLPSFGEQILGEVENIHAEVDQQISLNNTWVSNQLFNQNAAVNARLRQNEEAVAAMLGKVKNEQDGSFIKLWAGTEAQYAAATKAADTIYLVGLMGGDTP